MWRSVFITLLLLTTCVLPAGGQAPAPANVYVFPLFTDGTANGTTYQSVLKITETAAGKPFQCTLTQWNTAATFTGVNGDVYSPNIIGSNFSGGPVAVTPVPNNPYPLEILRTSDPSPVPLKTGYVKLSCPGTVQTQLQYSLFDAKNNKLGEATVVPAAQGASFEFLIDTRDGTRLGFSLTNDSAVGGQFELIARDQFNTPTSYFNYANIDAFSQVSMFVDELLPLPANFVGSVELREVTGGQVLYAVGLQFTGTVFTTLQPSVSATPLP